MSSTQGDDFQEIQPESAPDQPELELEAGPRAERPNFLTATRFVDFDLPPEILEGIDNAGFEYCTPIQAQAIPVAMSGLDIAGQAQTGTGKTTAFLVPLLTRLLKNKPLEPNRPRALIVTPTRELALQIHEDALILAGSTQLRQVLVIGGMDYKEQADLLATGPEIVICTPGRIIDYLQQGVFKTKAIEVAVVDEADRLLDMGFIKDLKYLLGKLPPYTQRQTMLFSATLDERVLELTYQFMNPPQFITAEPDKTTKVNIEQELYHIGRDEKLSLLIGLLRREPHQRVIIFSNTKSGVEWLAKKLTMNGFQAEGITGDLPQPKRLKLMEAFKENRLQILVATDVASRGIHVDDVSHVYNYDLPQDAENYVHRIGRTARAGNTGKAVSFGCEDYVFHLEAIENLLGEKIPVCWADQEMFQTDQGGEVKMKDRRGDRDRGKRGDKRGGRDGGRDSGGERRVSRGPAKSQRPGGIFGLSPRLSDNGREDVRHVLSWSAGPGEALALEAVEPLETPAALSEAGAATMAESTEREGRDGRRRKRRRGRRGRDGAVQPAAEAAGIGSTEESAGPAAQTVIPEAAATAPAVTAEVEKPAPRASSRRSSSGRGQARSKAEAAPVTAAETPPAQPEVTAPAEAPSEYLAKYPVKKSRPAAARKPKTSEAAPAPEPKSETPTAAEAKKPAAKAPAAKAPATRKPAAKKAAETAPAVEAKVEKAEPVKKPRATRKTAAEAGPAETPEPKAKKTAAKAPATRKPAAKKAEAAPAAEKNTTGTARKADPAEAKASAAKTAAAKKPATKKTAAKKEAAEAPAAPKAKTSRTPAKKTADAGAEKAPAAKAPKKAATPRKAKKDDAAE